MKKLIFLSLILFSVPAYAEMYAVERPDGGTSIIYYQEGSNDSLESVINDLGFKGFPIKKITPSDLPPDRSNRKYWKVNEIPIGKKIMIDSNKKQADEAAQQSTEARKRAVLKMTPAEFQEAKDLGLVK